MKHLLPILFFCFSYLGFASGDDADLQKIIEDGKRMSAEIEEMRVYNLQLKQYLEDNTQAAFEKKLLESSEWVKDLMALSDAVTRSITHVELVDAKSSKLLQDYVSSSEQRRLRRMENLDYLGNQQVSSSSTKSSLVDRLQNSELINQMNKTSIMPKRGALMFEDSIRVTDKPKPLIHDKSSSKSLDDVMGEFCSLAKKF